MLVEVEITFKCTIRMSNPGNKNEKKTDTKESVVVGGIVRKVGYIN